MEDEDSDDEEDEDEGNDAEEDEEEAGDDDDDEGLFIWYLGVFWVIFIFYKTLIFGSVVYTPGTCQPTEHHSPFLNVENNTELVIQKFEREM